MNLMSIKGEIRAIPPTSIDDARQERQIRCLVVEYVNKYFDDSYALLDSATRLKYEYRLKRRVAKTRFAKNLSRPGIYWSSEDRKVSWNELLEDNRLIAALMVMLDKESIAIPIPRRPTDNPRNTVRLVIPNKVRTEIKENPLACCESFIESFCKRYAPDAQHSGMRANKRILINKFLYAFRCHIIEEIKKHINYNNRIANAGVVNTLATLVVNSPVQDEPSCVLWKCFDKLKHIEQFILLETIIQDRTVVDVAKDLQIKDALARKIRVRALKKLKDWLSDDGLPDLVV